VYLAAINPRLPTENGERNHGNANVNVETLLIGFIYLVIFAVATPYLHAILAHLAMSSNIYKAVKFVRFSTQSLDHHKDVG